MTIAELIAWASNQPLNGVVLIDIAGAVVNLRERHLIVSQPA
jgi:hypothetical protein